jgi:hypothetical protein
MFTGRDMQLQDATGRKLAKLRPGKSGEKPTTELRISPVASVTDLVITLAVHPDSNTISEKEHALASVLIINAPNKHHVLHVTVPLDSSCG